MAHILFHYNFQLSIRVRLDVTLRVIALMALIGFLAGQKSMGIKQYLHSLPCPREGCDITPKNRASVLAVQGSVESG
jgi:hypothetical protein